MSEEIFNETIFINMVEEERKKMESLHGKTEWSKTAMGKAGGRKDGSSYDAWLKGREHLTVSNIVGLCKKVGWRPAWAIFGQGPKSDEEADQIELIRDVIASLSTDARRAAAHVPYVPALQLRTEIAIVGTALSVILGETDVNLPDRVFVAVESAATLLRRLNAPPIEVCRRVEPPAIPAVSPGASQGGQ